MITLAPFYKDINLKSEGIEVQEMSSIFDYRKNIDRLYLSLQKHSPGNAFTVCTDLKTDLGKYNVFRSNIDNLNLMECFCISNLDFVKNTLGKLILCGSDHLVYGDINKLFDSEFDVAVAVVGNPIRINNTIVLVGEHNRKNVIKFFERRLDVYQKLTEQERLWFGDQLSYQRILEQENILDQSSANLPLGDYVIDNVKIKVFKYGSHYVNSVKKGFPTFENPIILDFKGPKRKKRINEIYSEVMK